MAAAFVQALLLTAYLVIDQAAARETIWLVVIAGATAAVLAGLRTHRPSARRPCVLLAGGLGCLTVVNVIDHPLLRSGDGLMAAATLMELAAFPVIGLAVLDLVRRQAPNGDREGVLDGAIVMVALATMLSGTVFRPDLFTATTPVDYALLALAPVLLAGVATAAMRLLFVGDQRSVSMWLLAAAPLSGFVGHVLRTLAQADGAYTRGGWEDLPIGLAYALATVGALHPSMAALSTPAPARMRRMTHGRVAILGLALLAAPATLAMTGERLVPLLASVVLSLLVLLRLWRLVIERETGRDDMRAQANHDALTGLPNRTSLLERLDAMLSGAVEPGRSDAVLFLDLDGFKRVNDALGHATGDALLVEVARRLQASHRQDDLLARLAGDEFVVVCERVSGTDVVRLAERLIAVLEEPFSLSREVRVAVSIGVAFRTTSSTDPEGLLADADAAMYQAKQRGGSGYEIYGTELGEQLRRRRRLDVDLFQALQSQGLRLEYQPIVSLEPGAARRTVGFEALLRWDHPELGTIAPLETVDVAEAAGSIVALGAWVLREACTQLAEWNTGRSAEERLAVYVNVSTRELLNADMAADVAAVLRESGVAPQDVVIEVTETAALDTSGEGIRTLHALRSMGVRIALDDFGTGYSSLTHLKQVPFDLIKIDASFTKNLDFEIENQVIVEAVVSIARHVGAAVVGEGIEDSAQLESLQRLGCALGQGWLLGRPGRATGYEEMLRPGSLRVPG